jgi:hypothetical protein
MILHNFRCQYNSELKKTRVKKSGQEASERYKSQWLYFDVFLAFRFLRGCCKCEGNNWEFTVATSGDSRE